VKIVAATFYPFLSILAFFDFVWKKILAFIPVSTSHFHFCIYIYKYINLATCASESLKYETAELMQLQARVMRLLTLRRAGATHTNLTSSSLRHTLPPAI
jgi:hypothetical protein